MEAGDSDVESRHHDCGCEIDGLGVERISKFEIQSLKRIWGKSFICPMQGIGVTPEPGTYHVIHITQRLLLRMTQHKL